MSALFLTRQPQRLPYMIFEWLTTAKTLRVSSFSADHVQRFSCNRVAARCRNRLCLRADEFLRRQNRILGARHAAWGLCAFVPSLRAPPGHVL